MLHWVYIHGSGFAGLCSLLAHAVHKGWLHFGCMEEGDAGNPHLHTKIAEIPVSTKFSDGSEVTEKNMGIRFPKGVFVAMSEGKTFHYYDWREFQKIIDAAAK